MIGFGAALAWALTCLLWFDGGARFRPGWLASLSPAVPALLGLLLAAPWLRGRWRRLWGRMPEGTAIALLLALGLTVLFRLPLAWHGAVGYTTADGALSGIVALHVRDGTAHHVFVPEVPYSGSLKSHLTAPLATVMDAARAFALVSVLFYALFVAALFRVALLVADARVAFAACLYAAFAPAFVTHYSLSNDGNYVEVLAFGTWALVLAARWMTEPGDRPGLALGLGLLLGLGFWCHALVVLHAAAIGLALLVADRRAAVRSLPALALGLALGDLPGLLWNASHGWDSFRALLPGSMPAAASASGPGLAGRALALLTDHLPTLLGYDPGYPRVVDAVLELLALLAVAVTAVAFLRACREARRRRPDGLALLLLFAAVNVVVAVTALRYVPGNPRYLLFLMAPLPVLLARELICGGRAWLLAVLVALGALGSLAQAPAELEEDARWRRFAAELEREGVRDCYTDFYLATRINFLTEERVVCSAKLGPTRTEYFLEYRRRVDAAPEAAFVAVSQAQAEKLERRLQRLGVRFERRKLMKPVLLRLSRKVDPQELFPEQSFGVR